MTISLLTERTCHLRADGQSLADGRHGPVKHRDFVTDDVKELTTQPGGTWLSVGLSLAMAFLRHELVDEYRLYVHPVPIGQGKPLFQPSRATINLRLAETRTFGNGVVLLRYQRTAVPISAAAAPA